MNIINNAAKSFCPSCGNIILEGSVFCGHCGTKLSDETDKDMWICEACGEKNTGKTCKKCGKLSPEEQKKMDEQKEKIEEARAQKKKNEVNEEQQGETLQISDKQQIQSFESKGNLQTAVISPVEVDDEENLNVQLVKEYKELLDEGVITEEEFQRRRKKLFGLY